MKKKLAIITTHPIQYYAPYFKLLTERGNIEVKVFYTWGASVLKGKYDPGFKKVVEWDIPLLEGYEYEFLDNIAKDKGSHHFWGINCPTLISNISSWSPDALFIIGWSYYSHIRAMYYFFNKIPVMFRGDSTLLDEKPGISFKKIIRKQILNWVYGHVNTALYVGQNNKKYYRKFGLKDNQLVFAPHAIDNDRFIVNDYESSLAAKDWRHKLGIKENHIVFLFAGKLEPKKNPDILIEAFAMLDANNAHLVMVGNGELEEELKSKAKPLSNIHFIDFQNQSLMPVIYRIGDVFILPSQGPDETWGLAINEAMACGRPVIASDKCGGAVDLIAHGENGFIFKNQNLPELVDTLRAFIKQPGLIKDMGMNSLQRIKFFTFEDIAIIIEKQLH